MSKFIETANYLKELNNLWDEHGTHISNANKQLSAMLKNASKIPSTYISTLKNIENAQNAVTESTKRLNTVTKKQAQDLSDLINKRSAFLSSNKSLSAAIGELEGKLKKANSELNKLKSNSNSATQALNTQKNSVAALTNQVKDLENKLNSANSATTKLSNSKSMIGLSQGASDLITAFGVARGAQLFADIVKNIYETTKELQSLDLALKMVSETETNYANNKQYVLDISRKWGLEVKSLTQQYIQFYTASKGLLSDNAIKETFEGIAKAGSIMGLSVDKQSSAFYAIDQMMSKGTVTSEELKKQLGNALPGAIKAAAMAYMDLHPQIKTIQKAEEELYKAMKKGAIDSATYVPLIVKNFQKLYGIENLNGVNTLAAAQNRLSNSWTEMVRSMNESETSGIGWFFSKVIDGARITLELITELTTSWDGLQKKAFGKGKADGVSDLQNVIGNAKGAEAKSIIIKEQARAQEILNGLLVEEGEIIKKVNSWRNVSTGRPSVGKRESEEQLKKIKYNIGYYQSIIEEANKLLNPEKPKVKEGGADDESDIKRKRERIALNFDWIKAEYELKKAIIEKDKVLYAYEMDNDQNTLAKRLENRIVYSNKVLELLNLERDETKALNLEKYIDDKERNEVAFRNSDITLKQRNKNIADLNKRFYFEQLKVDENYSEKWQDLVNQNEIFSRKINDKKLEYAKKTSKEEYDFYISQLEEILNSKKVNDSEYIQAAQDRRKAEYDNAVRNRDEAIRLAHGEKEAIKGIWAEFGNNVLAIDKRLNDALEANRQRRIKRQSEVDKYNRDAKGYTDVMGSEIPGYLAGASQDMIDKYNELIDNYIKAVASGDEAIIEERKRQLEEFKDHIIKLNEFSTGFVNDFISKSGFQTLFNVLSGKLKGFQDNWKTAFLAITEIAQEAYNFMSQNTDAYFENERAKLERSHEDSISLAGDNEAAKSKIDKDYEEKKRQINIRQAKAERDNAAFNIAIDTAQAIMGLWVNPGFPQAIPLAIAVGALGALQTAMVMSKPLPQFYTGTDFAPEGPAIVDEFGPELHMDRFGKIKDFGSTGGPRIKFLSEGDKIVPAHRTKNIIKNDELAQLDELLFKNNILYSYESNNQLDASGIIGSILDLKSTIENKETSEEHFDVRGWTKFSKRNGERIESKNNRIRFKKSIF